MEYKIFVKNTCVGVYYTMDDCYSQSRKLKAMAVDHTVEVTVKGLGLPEPEPKK